MNKFTKIKTDEQASEVILRRKPILTRGGAPFSPV